MYQYFWCLIRIVSQLLLNSGLLSAKEYESPWQIPDTFLKRVFWVSMIPMHALFFVTIPDCRRPGKWHKTYPITFVMSIAWIAGLSYIMVWMVTVAGKLIVLLIDLFVLFFISSRISYTQKERLHHYQRRVQYIGLIISAPTGYGVERDLYRVIPAMTRTAPPFTKYHPKDRYI